MKRRTTTILLSLALLLGVALWLHSPYLRRAHAAGNAWTTKTGMSQGRFGLATAAIDGKLYAVGGVAGVVTGRLEVYDPTTDQWTLKAPLPAARQSLAAAAIDGKLYVVGGDDGRSVGTVKRLDVYDPTTNTWTRKADMSLDRSGMAAAAINGKLYVVGGANYSVSGLWLNTLEVYDPATDTWTTKSSMPTKRDRLAAAAINGKLYVVGGWNNGSLDKLEVYDPATDTWTTKNSMPTARNRLAAAAINGKLYTIGGQIGGSFAGDTLEVYNPITDEWVTKAPMPTKRLSMGAAAINGQLYAVGGLNPNIIGADYNNLEAYTPPEPNAWASKADMQTPRAAPGAAAIAGKLYVIGGSHGGIGGSTLESSLEMYDPATNTWTSKTPMPTARSGLAAAAINGKLYAVGGRTSGSFLNTLEVYDPATDTWVTKKPMPTPRYHFAAAAINGKLYVVGDDSDGKLEVYDPATDQWTSKTPMLTARAGLAAAAINGKLYVVGGFNGGILDTLEVYDPATNQWTALSPMLTARRFLAAAVINGKLYVVGGLNSNNLDNLEVYDPATDTWTSNAPMPTTRIHLAAATLNGKVYVVGGTDSNVTGLKTLEVFQVASDLTLAKSHSGDFTSGTDGSYLLTVKNAADANCTEGPITVTDTLPAGLSYAAVNGVGWDCTANGQSVTCTNASLTLDAGASNSFTLSVHTTAPGIVTNYASVATTDEIVTDNNDASNPTTIICPEIAVTLSGATTICPGGMATLAVDIAGGTAPYTVKLSDGQQKTSNTLPITFSVSPTKTTSYSVQMLTDTYACALTTSNSVTVTVTQPDTLITAAPPALSEGNASVSFRRNDNCGSVVTFECQLNNGGWSACTSPKSYPNLAGGAHLFEVRAKDSYGNVDASPAQYSWTVVTSTCGTVVNPAALPAATRNTPFVQTLSGAPTGSYVFSLLSGQLPQGITLVNTLGIYSLRGTPTVAGEYRFTIKAAKANSTCVGYRTYTITIP